MVNEIHLYMKDQPCYTCCARKNSDGHHLTEGEQYGNLASDIQRYKEKEFIFKEGKTAKVFITIITAMYFILYNI